MEIKTKYIEAHIVKKINDNLQFLALKRAPYQTFPNLWQPITGKFKESETASIAAKREIFEETGLEVNSLIVLPKVTSFYLSEDDTVYLSPVFLYVLKDEKEIVICSEHIEYRWVDALTACSLYLWQGQRESVNSIIAYSKNSFEDLPFVKF